MAKTNVHKQRGPVSPLGRIAKIAHEVNLHISDAIAVTRTAAEQANDEDPGNCEAAVYLIWYKLEKIKEAYEQITALAPYVKATEEMEGTPS